MQLWDQEAICGSPHKVPPAEVSVEVRPEPSLDDQLQLLIVSPDADALLNIKDQSETEIVAYCQTYASEQHIHSALADCGVQNEAKTPVSFGMHFTMADLPALDLARYFIGGILLQLTG